MNGKMYSFFPIYHLQNIDKTVGTGVPHVRVLRTRSKPQQCKTDVVAIQRVELINGNVQDPMAVRRYGVSKLFYFVDLKGS